MIKNMWLRCRCNTCVWVWKDTSKTCCCFCEFWCFTIERIRNVENTHYSGRLFGNHRESVATEWEVIVFTSASAKTTQPIDTCNSNFQKSQNRILPRAQHQHNMTKYTHLCPLHTSKCKIAVHSMRFGLK